MDEDRSSRAAKMWAPIKSHPYLSTVVGVYLMLQPVLRIIGEVSDASALVAWVVTGIKFLASGPVQWVGAIFFSTAVAYIFQDLWHPTFLGYWLTIKRRIKEGRSPFSVRPLSGDTLASFDPKFLVGLEVKARLAIRNTSRRRLARCSVRLEDAFPIRFGRIASDSKARPSICNENGEGFLLRWADSESATPDHKYVDISPDGADHIAEVLWLNVADRCADFSSADPNDAKNKCRGVGSDMWWKLRIRISSEDGTALLTEWVAACADRDPGPITLDHWHPRGEQILGSQSGN